MNSAYNDYQEQDFGDDDASRNEFGRDQRDKLTHKRHTETSYTKGKNRASSFNGLHRRRNKRMAW